MTTPRFVMLLAVALTTIAGCSDATTSSSTSATSPNTTTPAATVTITPTTAAPAIEALLDLLGPCGVITDAQAKVIGYAGHREDPSTGDRTSCTYTATDSPRHLTISISKTRLTTQSGLPGDTVAAETVGTHQAVRVQSGTEPACAFYFDAANRTVTVRATGEEDSMQACMRARAAAERMPPALL